jgi:hypothetical protein
VLALQLHFHDIPRDLRGHAGEDLGQRQHLAALERSPGAVVIVIMRTGLRSEAYREHQQGPCGPAV